MRVLKTSRKLCAFGLAAALVAGSAPAEAQGPGQRASGRVNQGSAIDKGTQELIDHALSMAIESSGLMMTARQGGYGRVSGPVGRQGVRGTYDAGSGDTGRGAGTPAGIISAGTEGTSAAGATAGSGTGTGGSRTTGLAGQESYSTGSPTRNTNSQSNARPTRDEFGVVGAAGSPGMIGYAESQLRQHARRGFEESRRLFNEASRSAGDANSPLGRYLAAARTYASSLELSSGERNAPTADGTGAEPTSTRTGEAFFRTGSAARTYTAGEGGAPVEMVDPQTLCLINHGVKEVLTACKLKMMARMTSGDSQAIETLRQHAQQIQAEGRQVIDALASTSNVPAARREAGTAARPANGARTGESLLDAATARTRDRDVTATSGDRGAASTRAPGTGTTGTGGAGTGGTGPGGAAAAGSYTGTGSGSGGSASGPPALAGIGSGGVGARAGAPVGARGGATITLAQQASDLVRIIDQLSNE
jgi:hypothetical protein